MTDHGSHKQTHSLARRRIDKRPLIDEQAQQLEHVRRRDGRRPRSTTRNWRTRRSGLVALMKEVEPKLERRAARAGDQPAVRADGLRHDADPALDAASAAEDGIPRLTDLRCGCFGNGVRGCSTALIALGPSRDRISDVCQQGDYRWQDNPKRRSISSVFLVVGRAAVDRLRASVGRARSRTRRTRSKVGSAAGESIRGG